MSKQDLVNELEREITGKQHISANDLDTAPQCAYCGKQMPYDRYNEHTAQSDYLCHILPGPGDEPTEKRLYCGSTCFVAEMNELTDGAVQ